MGGGNKIEINWEDDNEELLPQKEELSRDFESLLEEHDTAFAGQERNYRPGDAAIVTLEQLPAKPAAIMFDLSNKLAGCLPANEAFDEDGVAKFAEGAQLQVYIASIDDSGAVLSLDRSRAIKSADQLQEVYESGQPIKGKVESVNKGGFQVMILGKAAFCPVSQIANTFVEMPQEFVGQELDFLIEKFEAKGRNIVLSRRRLLEQEAAKRLNEIEAAGDQIEYQGKITRLAEFGAFVDLGGIEGLLHRSQMRLGRLIKPADVVNPGDKVTVNVLSIDRSAGRPKISLALCGSVTDPWDEIDSEFKIGEAYTGTVVQLKPFGAFVELRPGLEALLHVSEMAWDRRIHKPEDVVQIGEKVTVWVKEVDPYKKKLSVSLKDKSEDPWPKFVETNVAGSKLTGKVTNLKNFGAIIELSDGVTGMLPVAALKGAYGAGYRKEASPGKELAVIVSSVDNEAKKVLLTLPNQNLDDAAEKNFQEYQAALKSQVAPKEKQAKEADIGSLGKLLQEKFSQFKS